MTKRQPSSLIESAKFALEDRYGLRNSNIVPSFPKDIPWVPSVLWESKTHYIALEVSDNGPFRPVIEVAFSRIILKELPVKIYVAYPKNSNQSKEAYQKDLRNAKNYRIGLISIDDDFSYEIERESISVPLVLDAIDDKLYRKSLRTEIKDTFSTYINGDPQSGLQKLGQIVESKIRKLADQAKQRGKLISGKYKLNQNSYPANKLINEMTKDEIIDLEILGRCRGFLGDRNRVSHKPKTLKDAIKIEKNTKDNYKLGLRILEEFPRAFSKKKYKF